MQACHGDDPAPAQSAIDDVLANLARPCCPRMFRVVSANITVWRKDVANWMPGQQADVFMFQETHLPDDRSEQLANDVSSKGFQSQCLPALPTGNGGFSGGLAICAKKHLDVRQAAHFSCKGAGFQAVALRVRGSDLYLINLYLKSGEGFRSPTNAAVLAQLLPFLASVRGSFLVAGDFNDDFDTVSSTNMALESKGTWKAPEGPTIASGGCIDFGIISRSLSPVVTVGLQWLTPFKPHAALVWEFKVSDTQLHMPQARSFKPQPVQPQPFNKVACTQKLHVLGLSLKNKELAQNFADLSCAVELSVYGRTQGRGVHIPVVRQPLQIQGRPGAGWGGQQCAFWGRIVLWLESSQKNPQQWPFGPELLLRVSEFWQGPQDRAPEFSFRLQALQHNHSVDAVPPLLHEARHQLQQNTSSWMQEKSKSYAKWLEQSSQSGMRPLFQSVKQHENKTLRPFLDAPLQERIYLRWRQWYAVWQGSCAGEVDSQLAEEVKQRAIAQAQSLPPISVQRATAYFRKVSKKSPGIDGWTSDVLRNMSQEATQAVLDFLRTCELQAEWPIQIAVALVALLPKSTKKERPIALLHFLYRSYIRLRWDLIASWQCDYSRIAGWDKALPGSQVLDVALGRLMRGEATRQASAHMVTLFLDLENFYDRCRFGDMLKAGLDLGYPPLILHQAWLVYSAPRFLQADGAIAPPIWPKQGVLAGCPAAPSIAKLIIHPIAASITSRSGTTNLDVWVDDLSLDAVDKSPEAVARTSLRLFRGLRTALQDRGASLSMDKTCFVATSASAAKALSTLRCPTDPEVKPFARDLGVTSSGVRRRLLGLAEQRRHKARARHTKLCKLRVPGQRHRLRIVRASICMAGLFGHQALGVSPKRRKWYRTITANHLGRQKLGSLDLVFTVLGHLCEDPFATILRQHFKAVSRVFFKWVVQDSAKFLSVWRAQWQRIHGGKHVWLRVAGPLAASQAYLSELGVDAANPCRWTWGDKVLHVNWASEDTPRQVLEWIAELHKTQLRHRVSALEGCSMLRQGADLVVPKKLLKKKFLNKHTLVSLKALWQGALLSDSKPGFCKMCHCPLNLQHVLWDCPVIRTKFPAPEHFETAKKQFPWPCLWLRGLPPLCHTAMPLQAHVTQGLHVEGLWQTHQKLDGDAYVFASDASGGPGSTDDRLRCVSWAIAAYTLSDGKPTRVASISCLAHALSVPAAEQRALFELFSRVSGDFDVTVDCKSAVQILRKSAAPQVGAVPWASVWNQRKRANPTWVPSHKDADYFLARGLAEWRRKINDDVDGICRQRSEEAYNGEHAPWLRRVDGLCQEISLHLAKKVNFILQSRGTETLPWILQRPKKSEDDAKPQLVLPNPAFDKTKTPPSNKRQRIKACVEGTVDTLGHKWTLGSESASNLTMRCEICGLYVQQVLLQDRFDQLMRHPCKDQPSLLQPAWDIHHSHKMFNLGVYWVCLTCEKLQRPVSEHAAKPLTVACKGPPKKSGHHAKQAHANQQTLTPRPVAALDKTRARVAFGTKVATTSVKPEGQVPTELEEPRAPSTQAASAALKQTTLSFVKKF